MNDKSVRLCHTQHDRDFMHNWISYSYVFHYLPFIDYPDNCLDTKWSSTKKITNKKNIYRGIMNNKYLKSADKKAVRPRQKRKRARPLKYLLFKKGLRKKEKSK